MIMSDVISDVISVRLLELAELEHAAPVHVEGLEADADCHNNNERDGRCDHSAQYAVGDEVHSCDLATGGGPVSICRAAARSGDTRES